MSNCDYFYFSLSQPDHLMKLFSYAVATNLPEDKAIKYN